MSAPDEPDTSVGPVETRPPLFVVKGDASPEEVAALTAVLQALAAAAPAGGGSKPRPEWSAHHRKHRTPLAAGPGGWRASGLP